MQIAPINNDGYDDRGYTWRGAFRPTPRPKRRRQIDAVTFDNLDLTKPTPEARQDNTWLASYINSIPDEEVTERMKKQLDSYETIDDGLIDRLLMESL